MELRRRKLQNDSPIKASDSPATSPDFKSKDDEPSRKQLWFAAIKPPMYTVAVVPVLVGTAAHYASTGMWNPTTMFVFLFAAIFIIAWLNLSNDAFDFDTGADKNKKESVVNLLGGTKSQRNVVLVISIFFLLIAGLLFASIADITFTVVMSTCILLGYMYQGPPFRFSYLGLGEPICFVTWFATVCLVYYTQLRDTHQLDLAATSSSSSSLSSSILATLTALFHVVKTPSSFLLLPAYLIALTTTLILLSSHFHQREDDLKVNKRSPVVRFGEKRVGDVARFLAVFGIHGVSLFAAALGYIPIGVVLVAGLGSTNRTVQYGRFVRDNCQLGEKARQAKYFAVKLQIAHGFSLILGLVIDKWIRDNYMQ